MTHDMSTSKPRKGRDRPFPWPCGNCLKDEVYPDRMPYAIDVKHDGQLYHLDIPEITIPKCRACGELVFCNSVDDQILQALRARVRLLTPEQIRGGREALGLKAKELADKLGVAPETVSRWENGGLVQSRAMDNFLRVFFAVPEVRAVLRGAEQDPNLGTKKEGCAMSVVKNRYRGTPDYIRVLAELVRAAEYRGVTTYQDVAVIMGLPLHGNHMGKETGHVLGEICEDEVKAGRPMLSAVAVKAVSGKPGPGFFGLAKDLGRFSGGPEEEESFWRQELQAVYETWKRALHKPSSNPEQSAVAG